MRVSPSNILCFGLALIFCFCAAALPLKAQTASSALGSAISDPLSQEVLRALQQRGGGQTIDPGVQPSVQIQSQPVYQQSGPAVPPDPMQNPSETANGLSALERLMSLRVGQRLQQFGYGEFGHGGEFRLFWGWRKSGWVFASPCGRGRADRRG